MAIRLPCMKGREVSQDVLRSTALKNASPWEHRTGGTGYMHLRDEISGTAMPFTQREECYQGLLSKGALRLRLNLLFREWMRRSATSMSQSSGTVNTNLQDNYAPLQA